MEEERHTTNDREYTNGEITVYWKPSKCIHVTTCYRELIEVFNPRNRPWVNMQGAPTEEIIRVVKLCPTAALSYKWNKDIGKPDEEEKGKVTETPQLAFEPGATITVMKDGPLVIKGNFTIKTSAGGTLKQMKMASLCRCGHSKKMPFCDGSHREVGFTAD
jgi:uncharacterized Fe-S cluster protein YjdI